MATATATFTASLFQEAPGNHTGVQVLGGHYSVSTSATNSSVVLTGNLPNLSTIVDYWIRIASGAASQTAQWGASACASGIMAITTLTSTYSFSASISLDVLTLDIYGINNQGFWRAPGKSDLMPVTIDRSASSTAKVMTRLVFGTALSNSAFVTYCLFYTMQGLSGRTRVT